MKYLKALFLATSVTAALATVGCDRTVTKSQSTTTSSDGTVKSKETSVTQKADGTTVKTEESKKTTPAKP